MKKEKRIAFTISNNRKIYLTIKEAMHLAHQLNAIFNSNVTTNVTWPSAYANLTFPAISTTYSPDYPGLNPNPVIIAGTSKHK